MESVVILSPSLSLSLRVVLFHPFHWPSAMFCETVCIEFHRCVSFESVFVSVRTQKENHSLRLFLCFLSVNCCSSVIVSARVALFGFLFLLNWIWIDFQYGWVFSVPFVCTVRVWAHEDDGWRGANNHPNGINISKFLDSHSQPLRTTYVCTYYSLSLFCIIYPACHA